ncbi:Bacteroides conjugative transposon TraK protein [Chitinophaga jiangningensis]|uniref:Bacteroides conjugative transposon TraK protein n=1 Tax=Chitinophaga jiangningensis TaxID=1419482 RepID=A0A1M7A453_9BACT|nr:conjugative transposon protein TraK [Chitinophaga jiangningensis]SHL37440.1 Bacteroides conjugative transposon TraK protein [Chitinophaga jiangningensis]
MFNHLRNIDTAFKHIRLFSIFFLVGNIGISCFVIFYSQEKIAAERRKVMVLINGKLFQAASEDRSIYLDVEIRDHVKNFHRLFFTLVPDEQAIKNTVSQALYLCDASAKQQYDNLKEANYYDGVVSANINQNISSDSIIVNISNRMISFYYYGKIQIVRSSSKTTRSIITTGHVRIMDQKSDNNPHGFMIESWKILANNDIDFTSR